MAACQRPLRGVHSGKGQKHHMNIRILHSGCEPQDKRDSRDHGWTNLYASVVFGALSVCPLADIEMRLRSMHSSYRDLELCVVSLPEPLEL